MPPLISVIIPAFNEEKRIYQSLASAVYFAKNHHFDYEIIVADDGSTDRTKEVVREFDGNVSLLALPLNKGKGAAVREGMLAAKGDYKIFTDADFSTPIHEITKLIEKLENGADLCIGSRALNRDMIKEHQPFYRELMGKTFNLFVRTLLFNGIKDTQCGFKGFTANAAQTVFSKAKINGFSFDVEILYLARKAGLKIDQVAVEWYNDDRSRVNPISDSAKMFFELLKIRNLHSNDR